MTQYDEYFTDNDKPFAENLNDALLLSNVFDLTVPIELPRMFSNSEWVNTNSKRKAGVSIIELANVDSSISFETYDEGSVILANEGNISMDIIVYPNFNSYGNLKKVYWQYMEGYNEDELTVDILTIDNTLLLSDIPNNENLQSVPYLRSLNRFIIRLNFNEPTEILKLGFIMENKEQERYGATVGISDVTGLDDRLASIETKNTQQDNRLTSLEETDEEIFNYSLNVNNYNPNIDEEVNVTVKVNDVYGVAVEGKEVTVKVSEGSFISLNGTPISSQQVTAITDNEGKVVLGYECTEWGLITFVANNKTAQIKVEGWRTIINDTNHELRVNGTFAEFRLHTDTAVYVDSNFASLINWVPSEYAPKMPQYELGDYGGYMVRIDNTTVMYRSLSGSMRVNLYATFLYRY